jgi:Flp pilus assembly pilin Flp
LLGCHYSRFARAQDLWEGDKVNTLLLQLHLRIDELLSSIDGQDMVEYALVLGMLSFGITAASNFLAAALATAFKGISTTVGSYVS